MQNKIGAVAYIVVFVVLLILVLLGRQVIIRVEVKIPPVEIETTSQTEPLSTPELSRLPPTLTKAPPLEILYKTPISTRPDPVAAVITYWKNVSSGQYKTAWEGLSSDFQCRRHDCNYSDYLQAYQAMRVCSISTSNVRLIDQDERSAMVAAHLVYRAGLSCVRSEYDFEIRLVYNADRNIWLYDGTPKVIRK